jgi:hypothetical protein
MRDTRYLRRTQRRGLDISVDFACFSRSSSVQATGITSCSPPPLAFANPPATQSRRITRCGSGRRRRASALFRVEVPDGRQVCLTMTKDLRRPKRRLRMTQVGCLSTWVCGPVDIAIIAALIGPYNCLIQRIQSKIGMPGIVR